MESGHKSGGGSAAAGGAGADGVLCHACGYQYPNGHPSAKQRRAHRKHCGKPASAAATDAEDGHGEHDGSESLPGEGRAGAGEGIGASAAECGGTLPGSAPEAAAAVDGGDNADADLSSGNGTGHQVIRDKCTEDRLISSSNVPSEIISEASRTDVGTLTTVATQYSERESPIEDGDLSDPAVGSEQLEDVPTSVLSPEPEDGAKPSSEIYGYEKGSPIEDGDLSDPAVGSEQLEDVPTSALSPEPEDGAKPSSEISGYETQNCPSEYGTQNSTVVPLESNATGGRTSEQTDDVVSQVDGIAVTQEDDMINTIGKNKFTEDKSVEGDEFGLSCQDNLQTEIGKGHSSAAVEEDSSDKNLNAIHSEEIQSDETESNHQSKHVLTESFEKIPNIEVPVESSTEKSIGTDDDSLKPATVGSHLETHDVVKPLQQADSTSETASHLVIAEGAENVGEQHYPISEGSVPAISSAFGLAVGGTSNITENVCSSGVTMDDSVQKNVTSGTVVTSPVDPMEPSTTAMAHEINMVGSTNDVDEKTHNEIGGTDLTPYGGNEINIIENIEENQQNKEVVVDPIPHEADTVSTTDNHGENEQNEEIIADSSSCMISVIQSMTSAEEKDQIEEFIANLAPEETSVTGSRDIVEEKQGEIDVKTSSEIDGVYSMETAGEDNATTCKISAGTSTDDVEDKVQNEEITTGSRDIVEEKQGEMDVKTISEIDGVYSIETAGEDNATTREISAGTSTDGVEDKVQNEEITTGLVSHGINMICSSSAEEKVNKEEVPAGLSSHEDIMVQNIDNVKGKMIEETTTDTASHMYSLVTSTGSVEERKDEGKTSDPTLHERSVVNNTDNIDEKKNEETILDPTTTSATICSTGDAEGKKQSEKAIEDPSSVESNALPGTDNAENKQQDGVATADDTEVAQTTNVVEEIRKTEDTASKEISAIESTDDLKRATDQNEEIADKEMVTDLDKNHVSLKVLLADKNVETKEKEKKASTKDRVLSFRRRTSKDNVSPVKPGSPKAGSGQQDWNSPARLPVEKKPKGRKQQWVPFICCSSIQ